MKYRKIPTNNLGMVAYYLLQITQGIFRWNGELFFCPFVVMKDKKYPFRVSTWIKEAVTREDKKYSLPFIMYDTLYLFADPIHPSTYTRTGQRAMDKCLGVDASTIVLKRGGKIIIKHNDTVDTLEFIRKISDNERKLIFDPDDSREHKLRVGIWRASKEGNACRHAGYHKDEWLKKYNEYESNKKIARTLNKLVEI